MKRIYRSKSVIETEVAGYEVLPGLLQEFTAAAYHTLFAQESASKKHQTIFDLFPERTRANMEMAPEDIYHVLRCCLDFISGMTDSYAIATFKRLKGISLPDF